MLCGVLKPTRSPRPLNVIGRPKTPPRPEAKIKSDGGNDVWCVYVVFDTTQHGTTVKFLT